VSYNKSVCTIRCQNVTNSQLWRALVYLELDSYGNLRPTAFLESSSGRHGAWTGESVLPKLRLLLQCNKVTARVTTANSLVLDYTYASFAEGYFSI